ncbi:nucleoside deaminase [Algivirga pacifica]|uniref:tRNA-specific adenosine deaminase n=1 Tax=Algivirga pacifica TaxID=1162670 RepID=A0ABP9DGI7_9BACT
MKIDMDEYYMRIALAEAEKAAIEGEIPVGALVVSQGKILGKGYNQVERLNDPTAHAEMLAITSATNHLGGKYLSECTLYVTLEPCVMCGGATFWTQMGRIVFGAKDPKRGFMRLTPEVKHPKTEIVSGVLEEECQALILNFFKSLRTS